MEKPKILIVDDDPNKILTVKAILSDLDVELVECNSGKEALRQVLSAEFAVILLDVIMPVMDGFETAKLIRARNKSEHIPIIFVTAFQQSVDDIYRGYSTGAVDFILTPIIPEILRSKVNVFVELYRKSRQLELQMKKQQKFYSVVAHDLRTPFSPLLGFLDILVNDFDTLTTKVVKSHLSDINQSANKLYALFKRFA